MAGKGAKAALEPRARRLYAAGRTLEQISGELGVAVPTLSRWKTETRDPQTGVDEWDRGREQKATNLQRLSDLFTRQMEFMETMQPADITAPMVDALSKLGSLVSKWDQAEKVVRQVEELAQATGNDREISVADLRRITSGVYGV